MRNNTNETIKDYALTHLTKYNNISFD